MESMYHKVKYADENQNFVEAFAIRKGRETASKCVNEEKLIFYEWC